ncbi:MAG: AAA family ATPase [Acidobacteriota bacterium]|nr:AAA family ATPase [Acidobacteriota bacterium]
MSRQIPRGMSNFKELRERDFYFVDKSMLIADAVRSGAEVILLPRPRRFGKTLNLSMLRHFFDPGDGNAALFEGLAVSSQPDVMAHCGQYPTVFITLKDMKFEDYDTCHRAMSEMLAMLFISFRDVIAKAEPMAIYKTMTDDIMNGVAHTATLQRSLGLLTELIYRGTGQKSVVLIDEYDAPIHAGYRHGYYRKMIGFMRNLLSGAYKDNDYLHQGCVTGILRVAKESIFSGFNNPSVATIMEEEFSQHFGFTESEVTAVLEDFNLADRRDEVREWYNGYRFGSYIMYNPWSIMEYVSAARFEDVRARPYWVNTSENQLIHELTVESDAIRKEELETLLRGESVHKEIITNIVLENMSPTTIWSLLTLSGYLKPQTLTIDEGRFLCDLVIPNREVRTFFDQTVREWVGRQTGQRLEPLLNALLAENMEHLAAHFAEMVKTVLSFHDTAGNEPERVYHAFMLGLLVDLRGKYQVLSNRESGLGRYDIIMIPRDKTAVGFVFEFKKVEEQTAEITAAEALKQIIERDYAADLRSRGVQTIRAIGVAVDGKQTRICSDLLPSRTD